ncbi:MAG TPA: GNAT family N-acetyltransferase [Anaeromyxobacter sp.]|nr:GNAT family N-acetyltransferase [Anaeromyxobacter sp.]
MPAPRRTATRSRRPAAAPELREARASDVPALARMGAALAREHHRMDPARFFLPEEPIERGYAWWLGKELLNPRAAILVAARRGRPVGYAYGRIERRDWNTLRERCAVGVDLWVEKGERRRGLGRRLVEALAATFAARAEGRLVIQVAARNRLALGAFARMGFRETVVELARELEAPPPPPLRSGRRAAPPPS